MHVFCRWHCSLLSVCLLRLLFSMLFAWFKRYWWVSTCYCIQRVIRNCKRYGTPFRQIFFCTSWDDLKASLDCFKHSNAVYVRFSHIANFQPKLYLGSTSSFVLDREHSRYRKFLEVQQNKFVLAEVALRFWCRYDNFWILDVVGFAYLHQQIQLLGFGTSLNSIVAASIEHSFYLSIFQLSKRAHCSNQIFKLPSVWNFFDMAQTSMGIYTTTCPKSSSQSPFPSPSTTLGNHPRLGQQFYQTVPHGEKTQVQRNWSPGMLLH